MGTIEDDVQEALTGLEQRGVGADASLAEVLEAAARLILRFQQENHQLRNGVFQLEKDPAVCISKLFAKRPGNADNADSQSELRGFLLHQHILHNLSDGITVQDKDLDVIYQNTAMQRAFGCHLGEKCYAIYEKRSSPCEGCGLAKAFETGEPAVVLRTAFGADGTTSFWENSCFPIFDEHRNIVAGVEVCRNVSDRVSLEKTVKDRNIQLGQLNEELKRQAADLVEALRRREQAEEGLRQEMERRERMEVLLRHAQKLEAVGQLAAGIAHEINTPAQFVTDNLRFLRDAFAGLQMVLAEYRGVVASLSNVPDGERLARRAAVAEEAADLAFIEQDAPAAVAESLEGLNRISTIVRAMKEFAHARQSEKSMANVNDALQTTLTIARTEYAEVADVQTDFQPLPPVRCHIGDLNQVFLNLLINAAHAVAETVSLSGQKGLIRLRTLREGDHVRIDVQDTGCGIAPEIRDRVFEPFFTTKEVGRGSGQGLAIAYSVVVNKHGGTLTFESEVGRGTTFTIRLPIQTSEIPADDSRGRDGEGIGQDVAVASARGACIVAHSPVLTPPTESPSLPPIAACLLNASFSSSGTNARPE